MHFFCSTGMTSASDFGISDYINTDYNDGNSNYDDGRSDYNDGNSNYGGLCMPDPINDSTLYANYPINTLASGESMRKRPLYHNLMKHNAYYAQYHEYFDCLIESYFKSGYFEDFVADTTAMIAPHVEKDPTAFCSFED